MIKILNYTKNPLNHIGEIAGVCWGADTLDKEKNIKRAIECINNGHGRVTEYVDIEFLIDEVSCRIIREWYTAKIGTTNIQESTRYINMDKFQYFTPPKIANNPEALDIYESCMENIRLSYMELIKLGIPKEDVANLLPLGSNTKIVTKINLRALMHMFEIRECGRAYHEYRKLMSNIKKELVKLDDEWKYITDNLLKPKCEIMGYCNEKFSCGRMPRKEK